MRKNADICRCRCVSGSGHCRDNSREIQYFHHMLCDTNHILYSDYSEVIVLGAGADAVDYKLISICHKGDVVVSQDYGVAAMALGKGLTRSSGPWL